MRTLKQIPFFNKAHQISSKEVSNVIVLDRDKISKVVEINVDNIIHEELELIKNDLEEKFNNNLLDEEYIHDLREIQCIVNDAKTIIENSKLKLNERVDKVLNKVENALSKIKKFHNKHSENLPNQVFDDLKEVLKSCKEKLNSFKKKLEIIKVSLTPIISLQQQLEENSNKKTFENWAVAVDVFADAIEECFDIFQDIPLGLIEDFAREILLITSKKTHENTRKEEYKRRLKHAASFILSLIRKKRYESLKENSAEVKAIERIKTRENTVETEWITVSEAGRSINIDKINARLKKRGYSIQIPCEDSP
ncbi:hypothetical protein AMR41_05840 [Hapalosiphon sp. MRB220]|nr:hypothetical protein AMR41_05840 [Hapalosiphon sp. MRB220]